MQITAKYLNTCIHELSLLQMSISHICFQTSHRISYEPLFHNKILARIKSSCNHEPNWSRAIYSAIFISEMWSRRRVCFLNVRNFIYKPDDDKLCFRCTKYDTGALEFVFYFCQTRRLPLIHSDHIISMLRVHRQRSLKPTRTGCLLVVRGVASQSRQKPCYVRARGFPPCERFMA